MLRLTMGTVRARPDFSRVVARAGLRRADLAKAAGVSTRTVDALANPQAAGRQGVARELTAWKIARAFAGKTGMTEDAGFAALFMQEAAEETAPGKRSPTRLVWA